MEHLPIVNDLALIAALSVIVIVILWRLGLPAVTGLLLTGVLAGPHGAGLVRSIEAIEVLAELGVVLLLFSIGLEFSVSRLQELFRRVALGGLIQVGSTAAVVTGVAVALGEPGPRAIFFGFVFALSSTAIVLRALVERQELDAPHGRFIVGTLIFQDLAVLPMALIIPLLASWDGTFRVVVDLGLALAKALAAAAITLVMARFVVPRLLGWVDAMRSREVFLLAIVGLCLGTAWLTSLAGLSLALGAFLGGIAVAGTVYGHRAMGDVLPLRDGFVSLFFVSIGMLFEPLTVVERPAAVLMALTGFMLLKGFLATTAALIMRFPVRAAWLAGVGLAQFGEFGFVLGQIGQSSGIATRETMAPIFAGGIISMFATPILVRLAPHLTAGERLLEPLGRLIGVGTLDDSNIERSEAEGHVVVVGFGVAGRMLARSLSALDVRTVILELNADTVLAGRAAGQPIYYGDATSPEVLGHARAAHARAIVLLINDPTAVDRILDVVRREAPDVPVLARSRYLADRARLESLGAQGVVADEVEGGIEVLARVLRWLDSPRNVIDTQVEAARRGLQDSWRSPNWPRRMLSDSELAGIKIESLWVAPDSPAVGATLAGSNLRAETGALVVAIRRQGTLQEHPDPRTPLEADDVLFLVGTRTAIDHAFERLGASPGPRTVGAEDPVVTDPSHER
jgi:CPA2 family monovalent cation:H+ antiporter-2